MDRLIEYADFFFPKKTFIIYIKSCCFVFFLNVFAVFGVKIVFMVNESVNNSEESLNLCLSKKYLHLICMHGFPHQSVIFRLL